MRCGNSQALFRLLRFCAVYVLSLIFFSPPAHAASREGLPLNGTWEFVKVNSLDAPLPENGWRDMAIPGPLRGFDYERAWLRRSFTAPQSWQDKRILLQAGGIKFNSRILVNGRRVGGSFGGYDAFESDITDAIRIGEQNQLLVGVHDWTGVFTGPRINLSGHTDWMSVRKIPRDQVLSPIGGRFDLYGIWDDISLVVVPQVHIKEYFIRPSTRSQRLAIDIVVSNKGDAHFQGALAANIFPYNGKPRDARGFWSVDGGAVVQEERISLSIPPGQEREVTVEFEDPPLDLWWPHDPKLYVTELSIDQNEGDCVRERFGFREFWPDGGDLYLNGAKVHLLARSWWPAEKPLSRSEIEQQILTLKRMNANCFRTHTQPWPRRWYEIADRLGLLMIPEAAIFNDDEAYRLSDRRFWDAYAIHLESMVRSLRNHPSVVMWSLENEFHGVRARDGAAVEGELARLAQIVKSEDPTRPVTFESDGDPAGAADVIGLHYPNEYPENRLWPNDAYWMDQPTTSRNDKMFWDDSSFLWNRKKPLYIGEFLWAPDKSPAAATLFFGDEVYTSPRKYHYLAKAEAWKMQILAYRHYGVSGISPWGYDMLKPDEDRRIVLETQRDMFRPLAAFIRDYDSRFFSGEEIMRTVCLLNDTMSNHPGARLKWRLLLENKPWLIGEQLVDLPAGAHREVELKLPMPEITRRTSLSLELAVFSEGLERFREESGIEVFPRRQDWFLPDSQQLSLYDPEGVLSDMWKQTGAEFRRLDSLESWQGDGVLVIGQTARLNSDGQESTIVVVGQPDGLYENLSAKVRKGGRILVLAQSLESSSFLPVRLTSLGSTISFRQMPNHPILRGFHDGDFRWWRGDLMVSRNEPMRPSSGAARSLVVTGTSGGVSHAPVLEIPEGKGTWLICQLLVTDKLKTEPVAQLVLERMIQYLADYTDSAGDTLCHGSATFYRHLDRLGLDYTMLTDWSDLKWPQTKLLVIESAGNTITDHASQIKEFLAAGGNVFLHRPSIVEFPAIRNALGLDVDMRSFKGIVTRSESDDPLVETLLREDLYQLGKQYAVDGGELAPAAAMANGVFVSTISPEEGEVYEAEEHMTLKGQVVLFKNGEAVFGSEGTARGRFDFPEAGLHTIGLLARGTPCEGQYPVARVFLDGRAVGTINIDGTSPNLYYIDFRVEKGIHELEVSFINDARTASEDRNLYLNKIVLANHSARLDVKSITAPPAVVCIPIGQGNLILNAVGWDRHGRGETHADRFAGNLLAGLGARFRRQLPTTLLEAEDMQPSPGIAAFSVLQDHVLFGANGYIEEQVKITSAGMYRIALWAKGTPVDDIYPIVAVRLGEQELGRIECVGDSWNLHELRTRLPAGQGNLRFEFVNDLRRLSEDRNLWLDRIEIERISSDD